jgi:uncharacterized BrkB/YihY/UPF0761 family membrane protein
MRKTKIKNIKALYMKFKEKDLFTLAAAVSFYAFLSLFPFFIMLLYVSSLFLKEAATVEKIRLYLRLFPPSVIDTVIANLERSDSLSGQLPVSDLFCFQWFYTSGAGPQQNIRHR